MPQLFQVLKCYKCSMFQVHQTKKSNKWECKLCREKQSVKRHYGLGTGKDCRLHVQKLNGIKGEVDELHESIELNKNSDEELETNKHIKLNTHSSDLQNNESKWSNFIDKTELVSVSDVSESMFLGNTEVVIEVPAKKRRKFKTPKVHKSVVEMNEPECQQFFCKPVFTVDNTFINTNSSKIVNAFSKPAIPKVENYFSTPLTKINKFNDCNDKETSKSMQYENPKKSYVLPELNTQSKWAQFANEPDENDNAISSSENSSVNVSIITENSAENVSNNIFKLCDESELDDVLDF